MWMESFIEGWKGTGERGVLVGSACWDNRGVECTASDASSNKSPRHVNLSSAGVGKRHASVGADARCANGAGGEVSAEANDTQTYFVELVFHFVRPVLFLRCATLLVGATCFQPCPTCNMVFK